MLTHGASGDCASPLLVVTAAAFAAAGLTALRCDLPYRQRRPKGPPSPATAAGDRAGLKAAVAAVRELVEGDVLMGGLSYGGRQSTMLAAEAPEVAAGLVLLSYPLHPPGKPDDWRFQHFPRIRVPAVFVHGTRDPFGSIEEMKKAIAALPTQARLLVVEGAGHDLGRGRFDPTALVEAALASLPV
ncbi:MAG: dienelactone hydrolase family protein [Hyphomicrobiales bacterium]|nr:dienelactone hydrolase family protein [Hyphomicrobiales bacterium]